MKRLTMLSNTVNILYKLKLHLLLAVSGPAMLSESRQLLIIENGVRIVQNTSLLDVLENYSHTRKPLDLIRITTDGYV